MIEINLLPYQYRKRKIQLPDLGKFKILPLTIGAAAFLIALYILLSTVSIVKSNTLKGLNSQWQSLATERQEADKLKRELRRLEKKKEIIDNLTVARLLWAKKLNQLSDLMIDGIWFESLSLGERKQKKALILKGNVVSRKKEETALIGKFMQKLREDKNFSSDFSDIELDSIKRKLIGETEVMEFNLVLFTRPHDKEIAK